MHIYQPRDQSRVVLEAVVAQSYRRVFAGIANIPSCKLTLNINGALTELLARSGYRDVLSCIRRLAENGKLEFTESSMYHAFLPFLTDREIERQIRKNHAVNRSYFGKMYAPVSFFPPEMAYAPKVARVAGRLGYALLLLDEISLPKGAGRDMSGMREVFEIAGANICAVFRERRISNLIMSSVVRDAQTFREALGEFRGAEGYMLTAMDGETFGHHRPGLEQFLFAVMSAPSPEQIFVSEIPRRYPMGNAPIIPRQATWASTEEDLRRGMQFFSWKDPENRVHALQWKFFTFLQRILRRARHVSAAAEDAFDRAASSDQFFWASAEPWWSIEMIEKGAWAMREAARVPSPARKRNLERADELYHRILAEAFRWQRSGKVESLARAYREAVRIPFKERTAGEGKPEVYEAVLTALRGKMKEAADVQNYEKAILWRDAIWKLETKNDIYDTVHAVDLLRQEVPHGELERLMDTYKEQYQAHRSGQPEPRGHA